MDPRLLIQLAVAIDLGSINRAAKRLNVTQPTLSRGIKIIEDRVGGARPDPRKPWRHCHGRR